MKVYMNNPNENWATDKIRADWYAQKADISTENPNEADIIWIAAPWQWAALGERLLSSKTVLCTIHHIDLEKFDKKEKEDFYLRDKLVDEYHVPSLSSYKQLKNFTDKKINVIPFWIDNNKYFEIHDKNNLRKKYQIPEEKYVVGSFQRDTEGKDLISPKVSKGNASHCSSIT